MIRALGLSCENLEIIASDPNSGAALETAAPISKPAIVKASASNPTGRTETIELPGWMLNSLNNWTK